MHYAMQETGLTWLAANMTPSASWDPNFLLVSWTTVFVAIVSKDFANVNWKKISMHDVSPYKNLSLSKLTD
jgi:hypothetical protein